MTSAVGGRKGLGDADPFRAMPSARALALRVEPTALSRRIRAAVAIAFTLAHSTARRLGPGRALIALGSIGGLGSRRRLATGVAARGREAKTGSQECRSNLTSSSLSTVLSLYAATFAVVAFAAPIISGAGR